MAAVFPVLHLAFGPTVARAAAAAFLALVKPRSVAQTAHCVRIILYMVKSLGGSPYDAKASEGTFAFLLVSYMPLANSRFAKPNSQKAKSQCAPRARCIGAGTYSVHTESTLAQEAFPEACVPNRESSSQILMASPATSPAGDTTQQEAVQLACLALTKPGDAGAASSAAVLGAASLAFKRTNDTLKLGSVTIQRVYPAFDGADIVNGDTMLHAAVRRQLHGVAECFARGRRAPRRAQHEWRDGL